MLKTDFFAALCFQVLNLVMRTRLIDVWLYSMFGGL